MAKIYSTHIKRNHIVKVADVRKLFDIPKAEEILNFGLWNGRSPKDVEDGVSSDTDEWYIETEETKK